MSEEQNFDDEQYIPPIQKGDRLFVNDDARVQLDKNGEWGYQNFKKGHFFSYALGYKEAADMLARIPQKEDWPSNINVVFPAVFLYRQYIELTLKHLILQGEKRHLGKPNKAPNCHALDKLWDNLEPLLFEIDPPRGNDEIERIEAVKACIIEFQAADAGSDAFRYPIDIHGNRHFSNNKLLQDMQYINLTHLANTMDSLKDFFSGVTIAFMMRNRSQ